MWIHPTSHKSLAFASISLVLCAASACAQAPQSSSGVESEIMEMRIENGMIREQLHRLEEQQKTLLHLVDDLRRRLDGQPAPIAYQPPSLPSPTSSSSPDPEQPGSCGGGDGDRHTAAASPRSQPGSGRVSLRRRHRSCETADNVRFPILLRLWDVSQFRYTNTELGKNDYTDHLAGHPTHLSSII
jgi:hypothetical protein